MEPIVNTGATPPAAPRQPETSGAHGARHGDRQARGQAGAATRAPADAVSVAAPAERTPPVAAATAPIASAEAAAALVAQVREQFLLHPDRALLAHAPPGAEAALRLLDG
ncbi:MAG: hypothetical protein KJ011_13965 [Burkholderiaceae bacterium]|nr:hypothetical protein [Burkholderiaceae bacterium]